MVIKIRHVFSKMTDNCSATEVGDYKITSLLNDICTSKVKHGNILFGYTRAWKMAGCKEN